MPATPPTGAGAAAAGAGRHAGSKHHWEDIYARIAADEVSWFQPRPGASLALVTRASRGTRAAVIDAGGGASRLVDLLVEEGFPRPAVLDISEKALAQARERLGERASRVQWITADVTRWRPDRSFDVWHDRALFHFLVEAKDREAYRQVMSSAVAPFGQMIIGTFALDGPEQCSGLPVVRYDAATLGAELGPGYRLVETVAEDHRTPKGRLQRFQFCRFERV